MQTAAAMQRSTLTTPLLLVLDGVDGLDSAVCVCEQIDLHLYSCALPCRSATWVAARGQARVLPLREATPLLSPPQTVHPSLVVRKATSTSTVDIDLARVNAAFGGMNTTLLQVR
jgi:hypothetical protein